MKTTISSDLLRKALRTVAKAAPARPAADILGCFRLSQADGTLTVEATDGSTLMRTSVMTREGCTDGSACVPVRFLTPLSQTLPKGDVTLETSDSCVRVTWTEGESELPAFPVGDFPDVAEPDGGESVEIPSGTLLAFLSKTIEGTEDSPLRPAFAGVYFDTASPEGFSMVSSDTRSLTLVTAPGTVSGIPPFILHRNHAAVLKGVADKSASPVTICSDGAKVRFTVEGLTMVFPTVVHKYPNYASIIPSDNTGVLVIDRAALLDTLIRTGTCADRDADRVVMRITSGRVTLEATDFTNRLSARESVPARRSGEDMDISFRMSNLIKLVEGFESPQLEIRLKDRTRPALVLPHYGEEGRKPANRMTGMIAAIR